MIDSQDTELAPGGWQPLGKVFTRTRSEILRAAFSEAAYAAQFSALYHQQHWVLPMVESVEDLFDCCVYSVKQAIRASDLHLKKYAKDQEVLKLQLQKTVLSGDLSAEQLFESFCLNRVGQGDAYLAPVHMIAAAHTPAPKEQCQGVSLSPCTFVEYGDVFYGIAVSIRDQSVCYQLFENTSELRASNQQIQVIGFTFP
jgi:hypothetical protein